jgi:Raf kinase inhibitor-like YbhB/YbcL family protein
MTTPTLPNWVRKRARIRHDSVASSLVILVALGGAGCGGSGHRAERGTGTGGAASIAVTTSAFEAGQAIPTTYTCEGDNLPPPLRWTGVPSGTAEVAVVIEDPDAPQGTFVHWIVRGLPAAPTGELGSEALAASAVQLPGSSGQAAYVGPCPPDNGGNHHYHFEVLALPARVQVPASLSPGEAVRRLKTAAVGRGEVVGTFHR